MRRERLQAHSAGRDCGVNATELPLWGFNEDRCERASAQTPLHRKGEQ